MEYITLDKGIPVWIPVYEASLQFRIAKLGGYVGFFVIHDPLYEK